MFVNENLLLNVLSSEEEDDYFNLFFFPWLWYFFPQFFCYLILVTKMRTSPTFFFHHYFKFSIILLSEFTIAIKTFRLLCPPAFVRFISIRVTEMIFITESFFFPTPAWGRYGDCSRSIVHVKGYLV